MNYVFIGVHIVAFSNASRPISEYPLTLSNTAFTYCSSNVVFQPASIINGPGQPSMFPLPTTNGFSVYPWYDFLKQQKCILCIFNIVSKYNNYYFSSYKLSGCSYCTFSFSSGNKSLFLIWILNINSFTFDFKAVAFLLNRQLQFLPLPLSTVFLLFIG